MSQDTQFWNRLAKRYAEMPVRDQANYQEKLTRTREVLAPGAKVLEVGCGTGSTALAHAPYVSSILAIDFAQSMIDIAREKARLAKVENVTFRACTLADLKPQDGQFDAILGLNLVHLLRDPASELRSMADHLAPGGVLVLSTQCLADKMNWMRFFSPILTAARVFPWLTFFTQDTLESWLTDAGLTIEQSWQPDGIGKAAFHIARRPKDS